MQMTQQYLHEKESYPIDQWFDRSSGRYGHLVTPGSRPSKIGPLQISSFAEPDELGKPGAHDSVIENTAVKSPIRRILIPIDPVQVKVADLRPILQIAQRFDAEVTLFHCYEMPPSFCYARGRSALTDLILHRQRVRMRLLKLCTEVRRLFPKCRSEFASGSLPIEILRASRIQSDLIVVLLSPEFVSHNWTAKELMDELVRKANCAVLGISSSRSEEPIASKVASRGLNMEILETERSSNKLVTIKRVVVAVDLTTHSEATARYAARLANWFNASLWISHVFSLDPLSEFGSEGVSGHGSAGLARSAPAIDHERRDLRTRLDRLTEQMRRLIPECQSVSLEGDPAEEIAALARDLDADLIVIASHHPTFLARLFNWDKAPKITHRAPCPVLVYHEENP